MNLQASIKKAGLTICCFALLIPSTPSLAGDNIDDCYMKVRFNESANDVPLTFGMILGRGDFQDDDKISFYVDTDGGQSQTKLNDVQYLVRNHWKDGSARHLVATVMLKDVEKDDIFNIYIKPESGENNFWNERPSINPKLEDDLAIFVELIDGNGKAWYLGLTPGQGRLLTSYNKNQKSLTFSTPHIGKQLHQVQLEGPLKSGADSHEDLRARITWNLYDTIEHASVWVDIMHTNVADDVDLKPDYKGCKVNIYQGNEVVESFEDMNIHYQTMARMNEIVIGSHAIPTKNVIRPNLKYWVEEGLCPPYDYSNPITDTEGVNITKTLRTENKLPWDMPYGSPFGGEDGIGVLPFEDMGNTGDSWMINDNGRNSYYILCLNSMSYDLEDLWQAMAYNTSGTVGIRIGDPNSGRKGIVDSLGLEGLHFDTKKTDNPVREDHAHMPDLGLRYVIDPNRFTLDIAASQYCFMTKAYWMGNGDGFLRTGETHWPNRAENNKCQAALQFALMCPEYHHLYGEADEFISRNLDYLIDSIPEPGTDPQHLFHTADDNGSGTDAWISCTKGTLWQQTRCIGTLLEIEHLLEEPRARTLAEYTWEAIRVPYVDARNEQWLAPTGEVIRFDNPKHVFRYLWAFCKFDAYDKNGSWTRDKDTTRGIGESSYGYAAALYYTSLNLGYAGKQETWWQWLGVPAEEIPPINGFYEVLEEPDDGWMGYSAKYGVSMAYEYGLRDSDVVYGELRDIIADSEDYQGAILVPTQEQ